MHIALVSPSWPMNASPNGIVTYVDCLRAELIRLGHKVSIFSGSVSPDNEDRDVYQVTLGIGARIGRRLSRWAGRDTPDVFAWGRCLATSIGRAHRNDPIDVVEMEESFGWCGDVQRMLAVPLVVKLHGPAFLSLVEEELNTPFARMKIRMEGDGLRRIKSITAPSRDTLTRTVGFYTLAPTISEVVLNPMNSERGSELRDPRHVQPKTVLFVGRFDKRKGGDTILLAFRRLLEMEPDARLIFVGPDAGLTSPDGSRVHLEDFCGSHFTPEQRQRIDYRGTLSKAEISALRSKATASVVASRWDNQPNTALEAMAQGNPVVAVNSGGIGEIIVDGITGLLARPDDPIDLALLLRRVINDPSLCRTLGVAGFKHVTTAHLPEAVARRTLEIYSRAIDATAGRSLREGACTPSQH